MTKSKNVITCILLTLPVFLLFQNFAAFEPPQYELTMYPVASAVASSTLANWPANFLIDNNPTTVYSSTAAKNALDVSNINVILSLKDPGAEISHVVLTARKTDIILGFPVDYKLEILRYGGTLWEPAGTYTQQPDEFAKVNIRLPSIKRISKIKLSPRVLGKDRFGSHYFQLADIQLGYDGPRDFTLTRNIEGTAVIQGRIIDSLGRTFKHPGAQLSIMSTHHFPADFSNSFLVLQSEFKTESVSPLSLLEDFYILPSMYGESRGFRTRVQGESAIVAGGNTVRFNSRQHAIGIAIPDGYSASYAIVKNDVVRSNTPFTQIKKADGFVLLNVESAAFYDTVIKYTPNSEIVNSSKVLTCNQTPTAKIAATKYKHLSGDEVDVKIGVTENFGGIGTEMQLINRAALNANDPNAQLQIIDGRSAAGAAWQTSFYGRNKLLSAPRKPTSTFIFNQGAGNFMTQWGFASAFTEQGLNLVQNNWIPLYEDHFAADGFSQNHNTSPCYNNARRYADGKMNLLGQYNYTTNDSMLVSVTNSYSWRSLIDTTFDYWTMDQAMYLLKDAADTAEMTIELVGRNGGWRETINPRLHHQDPAYKINNGLGLNYYTQPMSCKDRYDANSGRCDLQTQSLDYAILNYKVAGKEIGIVIEPKDNQAEFYGIFGTSYKNIGGGNCWNVESSRCGNIEWHSYIGKRGQSATFKAGVPVSYDLNYTVGTRKQLEDLGYFRGHFEIPGENTLFYSDGSTVCRIADRSKIPNVAGSLKVFRKIPARLGSATLFCERGS